MKVQLNNEAGIVVKNYSGLHKDNEPGVIHWDTAKENDIEDWRGLFASFIASGGIVLESNYNFKYIKEMIG